MSVLGDLGVRVASVSVGCTVSFTSQFVEWFLDGL